MTAAPPDPNPATLREVDPAGIYRLGVLARLYGCRCETLLRNGVRLLPKPRRTSPNRVLGAEILRYVGAGEIDRAASTSEGGETQAERERRAAAAVERINNLGRTTK